MFIKHFKNQDIMVLEASTNFCLYRALVVNSWRACSEPAPDLASSQHQQGRTWHQRHFYLVGQPETFCPNPTPTMAAEMAKGKGWVARASWGGRDNVLACMGRTTYLRGCCAGRTWSTVNSCWVAALRWEGDILCRKLVAPSVHRVWVEALTLDSWSNDCPKWK